ncbi:hypothetical protein IID26_03475 [Patescibacteria group bacterium]|nr:hypothetical protein [Patescibacteria group bacterium]
MKKSYLLIGGIVLLGFIILLLNGAKENERVTQDTAVEFENIVISSDNAARLNFNDSALPNGLEKSDITISRLTDDDIFPSDVTVLQKQGFVTAFSFEPDGTNFNEPIEFVFELDTLPDGELPILYHVSENFVGPIGDVTVEEKEGDESKIIITGTIDHFSKIQVWGSGFKLTGIQAGKYPVGANVLYEVTIKRDLENRIEIYDGNYYLRTSASYIAGTKWDVSKIKVTSAGKGILVPAKQEIAGQTGLAESATFKKKAAFECEGKGKDLLWGGPISLTYSVTSFRRDTQGRWKDIENRVTTHHTVKVSYECTGLIKISVPQIERGIELRGGIFDQ